jgi:ketosteroid isomerase-like protein
MRRTGRFAVNILGRRHEDFARRATPAGADRFAAVHWEPGHGGIPLLADALAALECDIVAEHPAGDHWIVVARVDEVRISPAGDPLIFFAGAFGALQATGDTRTRSDAPARPLRQHAASRRPLQHAGDAASGTAGSIRGHSAASGARSLTRDTATGAMSSRVETIRRAHEALNSGDVEALVALCDPSFRLDMSDRILNPAVYEGHEGIRQFVAEVHEAWETFTWEPEELVESGDLVLALIHSTGRGRGSGLELDRHAAMLWTVPAERAVSLRFYRDRDAARRAARR